MFQESLVESTSLLRTRNRWPVVAAFAAQLTVALAVISLPLLHPEVLTNHAPKLLTLAPPPPPPRPPTPPSEPVRVENAAATLAPTAPATQPAQIQPLIVSDLPSVDAPTIPTGLNMGQPNPNSVMGIGVTGTSNAAHVAVAPLSQPAGIVPISRGVAAGMLLAPIAPAYPQMAKLTRREGTVVVEAVISKTGYIENAHIVSGPAMLQTAALEAVRNARYRPYLLNGEPTEVQTTVSINFRMND